MQMVFLDEVYQRGEYGQPVLFLQDCEWVIHRNEVPIEFAEQAINAPDYATGPIEYVSWG